MAEKTIRDKKPQRKKKSSQPERIGYVCDVRFGALIALGVSGYPHAVMFDPDTNPELVRFIKSFGTIAQDGTLHEVQWFARWTAISDNEATLIDIARVGIGAADYGLLGRDERHKWYLQARDIMLEYGITSAPAMASVLAWSLNTDLNDHLRRAETLQDANYRLHHQCSRVREERNNKSAKTLAAHAPAGHESSDSLSDWFPREYKPMANYPDWIDNPDSYRFAIPNHIKRELALEANEVGWHVRKCYDMPIDVYVTQHGTRAAYDKCVQYCTDVLAQRQGNHVVDAQYDGPPADASAEEAWFTDTEQEKYMQFPESPVVVFPQDRGPIIYEGIRFSVTLRIGGRMVDAIPLMEEYAQGHKDGSIQIDSACLVSRPAAQPSAQPKPEQPAAQQSQPAPTNGNGQKYEHVNRVSCDVTNGVTTYSLWGANAKLQWPLWKLETGRQRDGEYINQLLAALTALGIQGLSGGVSASVDLKVYWTPSENLNKNNQPYKDIARIVAEVPEKADIPF